MEGLITEFFNDTAGQAAMALLLVGFLDFLLGIFAAWRDKVFAWSSLDSWLRTNLAGRILPIWALLIFGFLSSSIKLPLLDIPVVTSAGVLAAAAYVTATVATILQKWGPGATAKQDVPTE